MWRCFPFPMSLSIPFVLIFPRIDRWRPHDMRHGRMEIDTMDGFITTNIVRPHAYGTDQAATERPFWSPALSRSCKTRISSSGYNQQVATRCRFSPPTSQGSGQHTGGTADVSVPTVWCPAPDRQRAGGYCAAGRSQLFPITWADTGAIVF